MINVCNQVIVKDLDLVQFSIRGPPIGPPILSADGDTGRPYPMRIDNLKQCVLYPLKCVYIIIIIIIIITVDDNHDISLQTGRGGITAQHVTEMTSNNVPRHCFNARTVARIRANLRSIMQGASGVLGSAVYKAAGHDVAGWANTHPTGELKKVDLPNTAEVEQAVVDVKPDWVIHCAAWRRPDVAEKVASLARCAAHTGNMLIRACIVAEPSGHPAASSSTSRASHTRASSRSYPPSARTHPLNLYGRTKRDGELAVLSVFGTRVVVLRVPALYGPAPRNADTAVNVLLDVVADQIGTQYRMDHFATRYPTCVVDIADFLVRLSPLPPSRAIPPILHYSAGEPFTKYEMCLVFAHILGVPHKHIVPDAKESKGEAAPTRPQDCLLNTRETEDLMERYGGPVRGVVI
ncbi:NAD-binding protein [Fomitopsis schrenkii]|uniref:NAD-binding protein n=1 Tax=Fomitopsis schrenkii TaxID=2126942 RepID=S8EZS9_FOMSC|nr:NAD-binding protein [Fomitopsis schrenkii]